MAAYVPPHRRGQQQRPSRNDAQEQEKWQRPTRNDDTWERPPPRNDDDGPRRRNSNQDVRSSQDARGRYVSAYGEQSHSKDATEQYATMVKYSRYRREQLGHRRETSSKRHSSPSAFGAFDHGRGLEPDEDIDGGIRIDPEGMVYAVEEEKCIYFCDRFRRYKFYCDAKGLRLLRALSDVNLTLLKENEKHFSPNPDEAAKERAEGYALYEEKPNLRRRDVGTWSDREYGLPGFQWMYLRLKSYQRFGETWALLERCHAAGLFDGPLSLEEPLTVVSLGGGPGYELLAFDWIARWYQQQHEEDFLENGKFLDSNVPGLTFASFDLQPSWVRYTRILGYDFKQWDVHSDDARDAVLNAGQGRIVCILSNILCYCSDEQTADLFLDLLTSRVTAIIVNERGAVQSIVPMLQRRGVRILRLLDQLTAGRDDRQLVFLPPSSSSSSEVVVAPNPPTNNIPLPDDWPTVFPNQPYEEKKKQQKEQTRDSL